MRIRAGKIKFQIIKTMLGCGGIFKKIRPMPGRILYEYVIEADYLLCSMAA